MVRQLREAALFLECRDIRGTQRHDHRFRIRAALGIAFGIDRMLMVVAQEPNLRDVIAFPKNQAGVDPMSGAPSEVSAEQLDELGIRLVEPPA